jgi:MOSC domain-containing protein YiiM
MVKRFLASRRTGFYLAVTREGDVGAGDDIAVTSRDPHFVPVSEITRLYVTKKYDAEDMDTLRRVLRIGALPDGWKDYFQKRLDRV